MQLHESRTSNGFGFNPIAYSEILAFFTLKQIHPHTWEIDLIRRLDREVLGIYSRKAQADSKKNDK